MKIDLNNYETWFLQYADGECSLAEQQAVEAFLLLHPSLKEELALMMEMRLAPEPISMPGKESLRFTDLDMLNEQYRLEPDPRIVFPDKQLLYKKEVSRIVYLYRTLSAAAVLLVALGLYWMLFSNDATEKNIAGGISSPAMVEKELEDVTSASDDMKMLKPAKKTMPITIAKSLTSSTSKDEIISPIEMQENIQEVVTMEIPDKVQEITKPVSNLSEEALKAAAVRLESNNTEIPLAIPINTAVLISDETKSTQKKPLRSLVRTLSRRLLHEEEEQDDSKFIQVASFHIHVKN